MLSTFNCNLRPFSEAFELEFVPHEVWRDSDPMVKAGPHTSSVPFSA